MVSGLREFLCTDLAVLSGGFSPTNTVYVLAQNLLFSLPNQPCVLVISFSYLGKLFTACHNYQWVPTDTL